MANQTEAPTSQTTKDNVLPKIGEEKLDFVTIIDQHWNTTGLFLTEQRALIDWGIPKEDYQRLICDALVIAALKERGIEVDRELKNSLAEPETPEALRAKQLSPLQLVVANSLLDLTDQRSDKKKLQDLGVTSQTYQRWLRNKHFVTYLREMSDSLLTNSQHEASLALADKVKAGDLPAIKFYMEYTGRYTEKAKDSGNNGEVRDIQGLLVKVLEIVVEECDGPTAMRIAERMKAATTIHAMAVDLSHNIVVPEVAPMREMTDDMKELMAKTEGGELNG